MTLSSGATPDSHRPPSDAWFFISIAIIGGFYLLMIVALLLADAVYMVSASSSTPLVNPEFAKAHPSLARLLDNHLAAALAKPEIRYAAILSLLSCTLSATLSLIVAVPLGYLMARRRFPGRAIADVILDIPIVLPPLVIGLSLLILFQYAPRSIREAVIYEVPAVILAQFIVACAFAVRTMQTTFTLIDPRREQVALTLGCNRAGAFWSVVFPEAKRGMVTAATLAWARSLGEFGPLLIFAGATRMKTEVLSTTVFLELSVGDLPMAVAVSMLMIAAAAGVLVVLRTAGYRRTMYD